MESLSIQDNGAPGAGSGAEDDQQLPGPPQVPQLPPQMFTTAAQLLDLTDKKLLVTLRDGRKFIGILRSWDQFANLVLQNTLERIFVKEFYADVQRGVFLVRGENVLMLGEIDLDKDDYVPAPYQQTSPDQAFALQKKEQQEQKRVNQRKNARLQALGFEGENSGEILF